MTKEHRDLSVPPRPQPREVRPGNIRVIAWPAYKNRALNPYNWLLYSPMRGMGVTVEEYTRARVLRGRYDVFHVHWPEGAANFPSLPKSLAITLYVLVMVDWARARGSRLVWTVHNLGAHDRCHRNLEDWFWGKFIPRVDGSISLSQAGKDLARQRFPQLSERPNFVVPIGHFRDVYPNELSRTEARTRLGLALDSKVLVFLGQIRPYKNVPSLVSAFRQTSDTDLVLVVAGKPSSPALRDELLMSVSRDPRVRLFAEFVPDAAIQIYLNAADLVVLPYREILNSASALLALSFDRPVLVPAMGALGELKAEVGEDWVRTYSGDLTPAVLRDAIVWAAQGKPASRPPLDQFDWPDIAKKTIEAYVSI